MTTPTKFTNGQSTRGIPPVAVGVLYALGVTAGLSLVTGSVLYFTALSETNLQALSVVVLLSGVFAGGTVSAKRTGGKGLVQGLAVGCVYFLLTTTFSLALLHTGANLTALAQKATLCLLAGALGGVFGVAR